MSNTFTKIDYSKEKKASIYVNQTEDGNIKTTLGSGENVVILNKQQAKEYRDKLNLHLEK